MFRFAVGSPEGRERDGVPVARRVGGDAIIGEESGFGRDRGRRGAGDARRLEFLQYYTLSCCKKK